MKSASVNKDGKTELYEACSSPFMTEAEIIKLIDSGSEEIEAALNQKVQIPQRFRNIDSDANVSFNGYNIGDTALHVAVEMNRPLVVEKLLSMGANPNIENANGDTPIFYAIQMINPSMVETLLKAGAKVTVPNHDFDTAMMVGDEIAEENPDKDIKKIVKSLEKAAALEVKAKTLEKQETQQVAKSMFDRFRSMMTRKASPMAKPIIDSKARGEEIEFTKSPKNSPPPPEMEVFKKFYKQDVAYNNTPETDPISSGPITPTGSLTKKTKVERVK